MSLAVGRGLVWRKTIAHAGCRKAHVLPNARTYTLSPEMAAACQRACRDRQK